MSKFNTHGGDSTLNHRSGQHITVIDVCDPCEYEYEEIGWMYRVRFDDGFEAEAFEDEIEEVQA